jgi:hypothetical protein
LNDAESRAIIFCRYFRHWRSGKRVYPKKGTVIAIRLSKSRNSK